MTEYDRLKAQKDKIIGDKRIIRVTADLPDEITIHLPLNLLKWSQEHKGVGYDIKDIVLMRNYIVKRILNFGHDQEDFSTAFERMIDSLFDTAFESGETWLEPRDKK